MKKRILSFLLALVLIGTLIPAGGFALAEEASPATVSDAAGSDASGADASGNDSSGSDTVSSDSSGGAADSDAPGAESADTAPAAGADTGAPDDQTPAKSASDADETDAESAPEQPASTAAAEGGEDADAPAAPEQPADDDAESAEPADADAESADEQPVDEPAAEVVPAVPEQTAPPDLEARSEASAQKDADRKDGKSVENLKNGDADDAASAEEAEDAEDIPEPADAEEEIAVPEPVPVAEAWPAQHFVMETETLTVYVEAEKDTFPAGTAMECTPIREQAVLDNVRAAVEEAVETDAFSFTAVDITFYDADGNEIEPLQPIQVTMRSHEIARIEEPVLVHVEDVTEEVRGEPSTKDTPESEKEYRAEIMEQEKDTAPNEIVFQSDAFSIYVIVETGDDARLTLNFYVGTELLTSVAIKKNDIPLESDPITRLIIDPSVGRMNDGTLFRGWTTDNPYTTASTRLTIDQVRAAAQAALNAGVADGTTVNYYAARFQSHTVTYLDERGTVLGTGEALYVPGATQADYTVSMSYTPPTQAQNFKGWIVADGGGNITSAPPADGVYPNGTVITLKGDVTLSVSAPEGHWLVFDENGKGATYNAPQFLEAGQTPTRPNDSDMRRSGYTFGGWYATKAIADDLNSSEEQYDFTATLDDLQEASVTVYARWIPNTTAGYTVIVWKQSVAGVDDQGNKAYDFVEAVPVANAAVGTVPNAVNANTGRVTGGTYNGETGFHYAGTDQASKTVTTEGNTVVNVYWDRNEITFNFYTYTYGYTYSPTTSTTGTLYGLVDGEYVRLTITTGAPYVYGTDQTPYTGEYYYRSTAGTSTPQYGVVDGAVVQLSRTGGNWYYNGSRYNGTRYYRQNTPYGANYTNYGFVNGAMVQLSPSITITTQDGTPYTGTRYTRSSTQSNSWKIAQTMTGLYGSTLEANGYTWPKEYDWYDTYSGGTASGGRTTFLDAFIIPNGANSEDFYGRTAVTGNSKVEFYKQSADGTGYELANDVSTNSNNVSFSISDKYAGFKADHYTLNGNTVQLGEKDSNGYYATGVGYGGTTLRIYYNRLNYSITFLNGSYYDGNDNLQTTAPSTDLGGAEGISYGADISSYGPGGANYFVPDKIDEGYTFAGWYVDSACTQPYTFGAMPEGGVTLFAKWIQTQYRVFLHPNAGTDPTLNWGSTSQGMNFRVSSGDKVSTPTGTRSGYNFVGWYTDPDFTEPFNGDTFVANDDNIIAHYDKNTDLTDKMDKWGSVSADPSTGHDGPWNSDLTGYNGGDRFWITAKLDLYAKWSVKLDGAEGIFVQYDPNNGGAVVPAAGLYADQGRVFAAPAPAVPAGSPEGTAFLYWVVQRWDGSAFVDTDIRVPAGAAFAVSAAYARADVQTPGLQPSDPAYRCDYTVQLKAVYGVPSEVEPEKTTTITYKANYEGGAADITDTLKVNETMTARPASTFNRPGWTFTGWNTKADGTGLAIEAGAQISADLLTRTDNGTDNILYAQWEVAVTATVTVTAADPVTYDGQSHTNSSYTVSYHVGTDEFATAAALHAAYPAITAAETVTAATGTDAGTYNGSVTVTLSSGDEHYIVDPDSESQTETITLTISQAPLTVTTGGGTKEYDGQPLTNGTATVTGLVSGETATATATGSQTEVGSSDNTYSIAWGTAKQGNYAVTTENLGTLTVTENTQPLSVASEDGTWTYDGQAHAKHAYTVTFGSETYTVTIPEGATSGTATLSTGDVVTIWPDADATVTDVADTDEENNTFDWDIDNDSYYNPTSVTTEFGTLTIEPAPLTITTGGGSKTFDGTPLTNATATIEGLQNGETATVTATGSQTDVGSSPNGYTITWGTTTKEDNYTIPEENVTLGTLTVTKAPVTVTLTGNTETVTYNGGEQTFGTYTVNIDDPSHTSTHDIYELAEEMPKARGTDAGTYPMGLDASCIRASASATNYDISFVVVDGSLTIEKADLTITAKPQTYTYNGSEQGPAGTYTTGFDSYVSVEGLVGGDSLSSITLAGKQTNAGTYVGEIVPSAAAVTFNHQTQKTIDDNYNVTYSNADLVINKQAAAIVVNNASKTYGEADPTFSGTVTGLANAGDLGEITFSRTNAEVNNVGTYEGVLTASYTPNDNYTVTVTPGNFAITPKAVTVTADDLSKTYGENDPTLTATVNGLVGSDTIEYSVSRVAGESVGMYTITPSGAETQGNYSVSYETGTFTINPATLAATAPADVVFSGSEQKQEPASVTDAASGVALVKGTDYTLSWSDDCTNAGEVTITVTGIGNYEGSTAPLTYKITKAPVTLHVKGSTSTVTYNGAEQSVTGKSFSFTNPTEATFTHGQVYEWVGNAEAKGTDAGTYPMGITAADVQLTDFANRNLDLTLDIVDGSLTIEKADLTITAKPQTYTYNGSEQGPAGTYTEGFDSYVSVEGLVGGDALSSITLAGARTNAGTYAGEIVPSAAAVTFNHTTQKTIDDNYNVTYSNANLKIDPLAITIAVNGSSTSLVYSGSEQTYAGTVTASSESGLFEAGKFSYSGTTTVSGTNVGDYTAAIDTGKCSYTDAEGNFDITWSAGDPVKLTIEPAAMTVEAVDYEDKYDGAAHNGGGTPSVTAGTTLQYSLDDGATWHETVPSITDFGTLKYKVKATNPNYNDATDEGTLTVTKRGVTLTSAGGEKVYDGTPLTKNAQSDVTVGGDGFITGEGAAYEITGSQTNVGSSENTFTYTLKEGTKAANYEIAEPVFGTLKVTPATMTLAVNDYTGTYDGQPHTVTATPSVTEGTTVSYSEDGTTWSTTAPTYTDVPETPATVYVKAENPNYVTVTGSGTVTISKAKITLTGEKTVTYNGSEQKLELSAADAEGVVSGETLGFDQN
ncbi:MAG: InlB B-repeat-containing protein, partial [Oscillospiraceae bacterium]|nr:InlB B-repeat-containing protein [Oscillospiraceae bacterium]